MNKRIICLLLAALMLLSLCACGQTKTDEPTAPANAEQILAERREKVVSFMREAATFLWSPTEDIQYTIRARDYDNLDQFMAENPDQVQTLYADRIYQGLPYTRATGTMGSFLTFSTGVDKDGVAQISGMGSDILSGWQDNARMGGNCAGTVQAAWSQVANSFDYTVTQHLTPAYGFLRVGEYTSDDYEHRDTGKNCEENGTDVMYAAYAKLQPGDAVVKSISDSNHVMLISGVYLAYNEDGTVSGRDSYVTIIDQTTAYQFKDQRIFNEELGQYVYQTHGVDVEYSFPQLFTKGYLPITCLELIDASVPTVEETVTDSENMALLAAGGVETRLYKGIYTSPCPIIAVTIEISDEEGNSLQKSTCYNERMNIREFDLQRFHTENPACIQGKLDLTVLESGKYHCTHTVLLASGTEVVIRDFMFKF